MGAGLGRAAIGRSGGTQPWTGASAELSRIPSSEPALNRVKVYAAAVSTLCQSHTRLRAAGEDGEVPLVRCPRCDRVESRFDSEKSYACTGCGTTLRHGGSRVSSEQVAVPELPADEVNAQPGRVRTTLVPVDDEGTFLVLGDVKLTNIELLAVPYLDLEHGDAGHLTAQAFGLGNVAVQGLSGLQQAQGLVRLAPETLAALRAGATPLTQAGWHLGGLQVGGKIVAQVRWAPVGAVGAFGVLTAVGPALAILAVQWQLAKLAGRVERNITLTTRVLDELRTESWYELEGAVTTVLDDVKHAMAMGVVTESLWEQLQAQAVVPTLTNQRAKHLKALGRRYAHFRRLSSDEERKIWLEDDYTELLRNAHGVLAAEWALFLYQAMRTAHLRSTGSEQEKILADRVEAATLDEHRKTERLLDEALHGLNVALSLLLEADPKRTLKLGKTNVPVQEIQRSVVAVQQQQQAPSMHCLLRGSPPFLAQGKPWTWTTPRQPLISAGCAGSWSPRRPSSYLLEQTSN